MEAVAKIEPTPDERRQGVVTAVAWQAIGPNDMMCITVVLFTVDTVYYGSSAAGLYQKIPVIDLIIKARQTAMKGDRRICMARIRRRVEEAQANG